MKRLVILFAILVMAVLAVAAVVLPSFARAKVYGGPGLTGNLRLILLAKEMWIADGKTNEWPSAEDLGFAAAGKSFQQVTRPRYGEIYFINSTGAPPFAYFPKTGGGYRAGDIVVLTTNGLMKVRQ
jgi:hypothetical protein